MLSRWPRPESGPGWQPPSPQGLGWRPRSARAGDGGFLYGVAGDRHPGALREKAKTQMEPMFDRGGAGKQTNAGMRSVSCTKPLAQSLLSVSGDNKNTEVTRRHQVHELSSWVSEGLAHEIEIKPVISFLGFL